VPCPSSNSAWYPEKILTASPIACGLGLLSEGGKLVKRKYWIHNGVLSKRKGRRILHSVWNLKGNGKYIFKYFRTGISKSDKFNELLPTDTTRTHNGDAA
jgi:hypothetical protein